MTRMRKTFYLVLLFVLGVMTSCKEDLVNAGSSILTFEDSIIVKYDTFGLASQLRISPRVISSPDSFLVGELETRYGTVRAQMFSQLSCPEGFRFPATAEIDSMCLTLYYSSWVGDANSPLALNVYECDNKIDTSLNSIHYTSEDVSQYCSKHDSVCIISGQRIVVASAPKDSSTYGNGYIYKVQFRLTDDFVERFTKPYVTADASGENKAYTQEEFNEFFKGLCVCTDFGSSTIINLIETNMAVYYHFAYERQEETGLVKDTVTDVKAFYANAEVRQINALEYINNNGDADAWKSELESLNPDINYVIAPAGIYTTLSLPMARMADTIQANLMGKRPYINLAELRVDVLDIKDEVTNPIASDEWLNASSHMLLIKDDVTDDERIERFFRENELPNDTLAILGTLTVSEDSLGVVSRYYSFDLSTMLTNEVRDTVNSTPTLYMTLVPVTVETTSTSSSTAVTGVKQAQTLSTTLLRSAQSSAQPMKLNVLYSGF